MLWSIGKNSVKMDLGSLMAKKLLLGLMGPGNWEWKDVNARGQKELHSSPNGRWTLVDQGMFLDCYKDDYIFGA